MKHLIAVALWCLATGAQGHVREDMQSPAVNMASGVVVQGNGQLSVRVDGQLISLNGAEVKDANGQRGSTRLVAGMPITFILAPEGTSPRIKEVWTTK